MPQISRPIGPVEYLAVGFPGRASSGQLAPALGQPVDHRERLAAPQQQRILTPDELTARKAKILGR